MFSNAMVYFFLGIYTIPYRGSYNEMISEKERRSPILSERSKFANEPLMYIHQPTQGKPSAPMQHSYMTPKKSAVSALSPQTEKNTTPTPIKKRPTLNSFHNDIAEKPQKSQKPQVKQKRPSISGPKEEKMIMNTSSPQIQEQSDDKSKKKFKDMTIQEKVHYFINTPSHLPRMKCEVRTEERKYRGIILDLEDNEVRMRVGRRTVFITMEDIIEIQLLGLGL
jgi:hypothetical protein